MFAPHCPTCRRRVLLGAGRIVHVAWDGRREAAIVLRCFCGALLDSAPQPPARATAGPAEENDDWPLGA